MTDERDLATDPTVQTLANRYLALLNEALTQHGDEPPFAELRDLADHLDEGREVSLKVVDETGRPEAYLRTRYSHGAFAPVKEGLRDPDTHFVLSRRYLHELFAAGKRTGDAHALPGSRALIDQLRFLLG